MPLRKNTYFITFIAKYAFLRCNTILKYIIFASSTTINHRAMKEQLDQIIKALDGFYNENDFIFSKSICEDGRVSLYAVSNFGIKVRMSNHSVISISRIITEVHLPEFRKCGSIEGCISEWKKYFDHFYSR